MALGPSKSILRVKEGYIYGWSGSVSLTSSAVTLLDYNSPSSFYLTRVVLGIDWSSVGAGETISYTINVDGQGLFTEKYVIGDPNAVGNVQQPKMLEFVIPPNSSVKIMATESANNGAMSCMLTGYKI
tara:strand:- start:74 stop:457 length:384 start_codon:yes stop_codon:yes gene_type:complete